MKCQHGNEITVIIERYSKVCWDDGICQYNSKGEQCHYLDNQRGRKFERLLIKGCPKCKTIKFEEE